MLNRKEIEPKLKKLIGKKVIKVTYFGEHTPFNSGFILEFDNGDKLTAQDGEYGDNAFSFIGDKKY